MKKLFDQLPLRQFPELDSLRFLSIFLVVVHHQFFTQNSVLSWFGSHGWVGVDIFFVLSGFLITSLLLKELESTGGINLRLFWFRRMLRLWPSWLLAIALSTAMVYVVGAERPVLREKLSVYGWHYILHVGNYSQAFFGKLHNFFGIYWSLAVEEHFYLVWPLLLCFVRGARWRLLCMLALVVLPVLVRAHHLTHGFEKAQVTVMTHARFDELMLGCLLAVGFPRLPTLRPTAEGLLTATMLLLFYLGLHVCKPSPIPALYALSYTLIGVASVLLIVIALRGGARGLRRVLKSPWLARLGVLSYGVYLIHLQTNALVFALLERYPVIRDENLVALVNLALPFLPAFVMFRYVDAYFARLRPKH